MPRKEKQKGVQTSSGDLPDGDFQVQITYINHFSKFCVLRSLKSKRAQEVDGDYLDIFHYLVPQKCLHQSDMAVNLSTSLLRRRPWHPQSQGGVERLNEIIQNNLAIWMKKTTVMFGEESSAEVKSHPLPQSLPKKTTDEEEVEIFFTAEGQKNCAVAVIAKSKKSVTVIAAGRCTMLKIPKVDRDPADPRNLPMVVLKINKGLHTVGCRQGILASKYTATDLMPIKDALLSTTDIQNVEVSVQQRQSPEQLAIKVS
ncbi:KRAB-A domain-containing protein 2 [Trichinella patagoniensis]|uniref:KRAB-A domain-containing protein 2 n=1 Tax=Trichinella patagoniensis TaxID=990121 RepID=A0A0V0Z907_9BILA|nr:KRAB-A domain-containing protein 2 [Trichinella patagoniensis]